MSDEVNVVVVMLGQVVTHLFIGPCQTSSVCFLNLLFFWQNALRPTAGDPRATGFFYLLSATCIEAYWSEFIISEHGVTLCFVLFCLGGRLCLGGRRSCCPE